MKNVIMKLSSCNSLRKYSTQLKTNYFVTTPIYYVNANPHIGHLYSSVIADAHQRWKHLYEHPGKIKFATGTDEHGSKIQQAAEACKTDPKQYCNKVSEKYKELANAFSVGYTDFVRTTDNTHGETVNQFWRVLEDKGHIYRAKYQGWYCVADETFLSETQLKEQQTADGTKVLLSADSGHPVHWTEEDNYIFKLSSFQDDLKYWLTHDEVVKPRKFQKQLLDWVESGEGLKDVSVSRPVERVGWGIPVPGDPTQTVYVWLDALANYLTVAGFTTRHQDTTFSSTWPPDLHVIGKDILKFHGIYWPAFLMAGGMEPPRGILCHSHWTVDSEKMSKSKGNVVCPFDRSSLYTADGLRYFLLREGVAHSDGNYSDTKVLRILNSELADTLGNLLSRCCGAVLNPHLRVPEMTPDALHTVSTMAVTKELMDQVIALPGICVVHYEECNFYKVVDSVIGCLHTANCFFETLKPWELKKGDRQQLDQLDVVLHITMETLRVCGVLLHPIIPNISKRILDKLNVSENGRCYSSLNKLSWKDPHFESRPLSSDSAVIFRRIILKHESKREKNVKR